MKYFGKEQLEKMKKIMKILAMSGVLAFGASEAHSDGLVNLDNGGRSGNTHYKVNTRDTATKKTLIGSPLDTGNWNCIGPNNLSFFIYGGNVMKSSNSPLKVRRPHAPNTTEPRVGIENSNGSVTIPGSEGPTICSKMKPYKAMKAPHSPVPTQENEDLIRGRLNREKQPNEYLEGSPNARQEELYDAISRSGQPIVSIGQYGQNEQEKKSFQPNKVKVRKGPKSTKGVQTPKNITKIQGSQEYNQYIKGEDVPKSLEGLFPELVKGTSAQDRAKVKQDMEKQKAIQEQERRTEEALKGLE